MLHRDASSHVSGFNSHITDLDTCCLLFFFFSYCLLALLENILGANFSGIYEEKTLLQMLTQILTQSTSPSESRNSKDLQP